MKLKWIRMYLDIAERISQESKAVRLKVGAVFVSQEGVMSIGINGLPAGGSNECEHQIFNNEGVLELKTKLEVSHAEENLFGKLMRQGVSTKGGRLFITHPPCIHCAKIIVVAGIKEVYYRTYYSGSHSDGISWMENNGILVLRVE